MTVLFLILLFDLFFDCWLGSFLVLSWDFDFTSDYLLILLSEYTFLITFFWIGSVNNCTFLGTLSFGASDDKSEGLPIFVNLLYKDNLNSYKNITISYTMYNLYIH